MNLDKETDKSLADRCIGFIVHILAFCMIFLLLMVISHSVIAEEQIVKSSLDEQILVAVFEDHNEQVTSSMPYGLSWKLIEKAAEQQELDLIKVATTWQSGINRLKEGRLDLMFGAFDSEKRKTWAQFTLPLGSDSSVLFSAIDSPISMMAAVDFDNEVVGVISNSTQETLARKVGFKHIYPAKVRKRLYKLLERGRVNYVLLGHSSIALYCDKPAPCVQQVGEPLADNFVRSMALKDSLKGKKIIARLNNGLRAIYANSDTLNLFLEHGYSYDYYDSWKASFKNEVLESLSTSRTQ